MKVYLVMQRFREDNELFDNYESDAKDEEGADVLCGFLNYEKAEEYIESLFESWFNEYDRELDREEAREIWETDFKTFIQEIEVVE